MSYTSAFAGVMNYLCLMETIIIIPHLDMGQLFPVDDRITDVVPIPAPRVAMGWGLGRMKTEEDYHLTSTVPLEAL